MKKFFKSFKQRSKFNRFACVTVGYLLIINIVSVIIGIATADWSDLPVLVICTLTTTVALASIYISE